MTGQGRAWVGAGGRGYGSAARLDLATDPLEVVYCLWATDHGAKRNVSVCIPVLQGLSRGDLKATGRMVQFFGGP